MDFWTDCLAHLVGAALAVSTIFLPFGIVLIESGWTSHTREKALYLEQ